MTIRIASSGVIGFPDADDIVDRMDVTLVVEGLLDDPALFEDDLRRLFGFRALLPVWIDSFNSSCASSNNSSSLDE
jgi:hypothetical protein